MSHSCHGIKLFNKYLRSDAAESGNENNETSHSLPLSELTEKNSRNLVKKNDKPPKISHQGFRDVQLNTFSYVHMK